LKALIVTNMWPTAERPAFGRFVADQVRALGRGPGVSVEVFSFAGGGSGAYLRAAREARRRCGAGGFDVVHAHYGLSAAVALAVPAEIRAITLHGSDLAVPRSRLATLALLRRFEVVAAVSGELASGVPRWAAPRGVSVLPCGVDTDRFRPADRGLARRALGLSESGRYLLLAADPARPEKRADLARALAGAVGYELLTLGLLAPEVVPQYVNAADAVVVPSDREGFGLACLEALACDVPVLATPHGVAVEALRDVAGCLVAEFDLAAWTEAVLGAPERVAGRAVAERYSADAMAARVVEAWRERLGRR
jgi:glycosyltransferase involved in cell wall biosynthesis